MAATKEPAVTVNAMDTDTQTHVQTQRHTHTHMHTHTHKELEELVRPLTSWTSAAETVMPLDASTALTPVTLQAPALLCARPDGGRKGTRSSGKGMRCQENDMRARNLHAHKPPPISNPGTPVPAPPPSSSQRRPWQQPDPPHPFPMRQRLPRSWQ
jgi:hypothetical protein